MSMNFDNAQKELLNYCKNHTLWRNFLPIAELLIFATHIILILGNFIGLGIFSTLVSILATISIVMILVKGNYKVLTIGLILKVVNYILGLLVSLIAHRYLAASNIIYALIWGMFALQAYKKANMSVNDLRAAATISGIKNNMNMEEAKEFNFNNLRKDVVDSGKATMDQVNNIKNEFKNGQQDNTL